MLQGPMDDHPDHIGPYRLLRVLGEGGMGIVYEAEQRVTVRRKVAVKVMKPGLDTKEVIARFEAERQALAVMEHPGIAKVLDAGATEGGRPYFVMELVRGQPLRDYADARKLSIRERLELFVRVCHAVQHAHHKGVIHRDLKPSNILVEEREGTATPRVIDFGIAKATGQRLSEVTLVTQLGQALGTPAYMSPEQAEASGLDVDMRTDVYSLGVTLYELLVGRLPIDPAEVGAQGFMYQLLMRESDPPTPSTKYRTLEGEYRSAVATFRRTDPSGLRKELTGDLDSIVMKAMEKDRDRRYDAVSALAQDIRRHLRHEPVWASSPNVAYRVRKFVRRHRVGVMAGAAMATGLVGGSVLATAGMIRARNAERNAAAEGAAAREIADFLEGVFVGSDPYAAPGEITAREILDNGAEKIRTELDGQPETQARLMNVIGNVYGSLGLYDVAASMLESSLALREDLYDGDHPGVAESASDLATLYVQQGEYEKAEPLYKRGLAIRERLHGPDHLDVAESFNNMATLYHERGQFSEAELFLRKALAIREDALGPTDTTVANTLDNLAVVSGILRNNTEAEALFQRALGIRESTLGPDHPDVASSLSNLGAAYWRQGEFSKAEPLLLRALAIWEKRLGPEHLDVANALNNLASNYLDQGRATEAEPLLRRALAIREAKLDPDHPLVATSLNNLATLYYTSERVAEAAPLFQTALTIWEKKLEPDHPNLQAAFSNLGRVYWKLDKLGEAEPLTRRALAILEQDDHPKPLDLGWEMLSLADIYRDQARYSDAESLYRRAIVLLEDSLPGDPLITEALTSYTTSLRRSGNTRAADSLDARAAAVSPPEEHLPDSLP
ncbi:MAG: serine/threonine-protein kinase [Gemmatimonadota bacterium]|nr:serine/threonine-protein kinase [Gemmatimonadota bacterium]